MKTIIMCRNLLLMVLSMALLQSCATTKTVGVNKLSYAQIIEAINGGLFLAKTEIENSQYELKEGSIKLYASGNTSIESGIAVWIIEGGYNWNQEKASSVTYKFSEIKSNTTKENDGTISESNPINPPNIQKMIEKAIQDFDSVDAITDLKKEGFDLSLKFAIKETINGKFNLDFGVGASLGGANAKSVAHEVSLSFKKE